MKYLDEYRQSAPVQALAERISRVVTRGWTLMEVCGGQTHSIAKYGLQNLLPSEVHLIHGPGCPVCVTPLPVMDHAIQLAARPGLVFCTFGDMLRVPGSGTDLARVRAEGGDVRIVLSPMDALEVAAQNPDKEIIFFAIGFETTAPANAMAIDQAKRRGMKNISFLVSQVLVPPAMKSLLESPQSRVQGFLAAGHVCTVMGYQEYETLARDYRVPIVVTGFEPLDILMGIEMCVRQLEEGRFEVENQYARSVNREGNRVAQKLIQEVFQVVPRQWRGIGDIPASGMGLRAAYQDLDAERRFPKTPSPYEVGSHCISGSVLQGIKKPFECEAFGSECTPENPLGATMVSSEGACAAYYRYGIVSQ